jgi:hypothetical protein
MRIGARTVGRAFSACASKTQPQPFGAIHAAVREPVLFSSVFETSGRVAESGFIVNRGRPFRT